MVCCGCSYTVLLSENGRLTEMGKKQDIRQIDINENFVSIGAGYKHCLAINEKGKMFCLGKK